MLAVAVGSRGPRRSRVPTSKDGSVPDPVAGSLRPSRGLSAGPPKGRDPFEKPFEGWFLRGWHTDRVLTCSKWWQRVLPSPLAPPGECPPSILRARGPPRTSSASKRNFFMPSKLYLLYRPSVFLFPDVILTWRIGCSDVTFSTDLVHRNFHMIIYYLLFFFRGIPLRF